MKQKKLVDFKPGDLVNLYLLIGDAKQLTTKTNKPYLNINFSDKSGELNGKKWDATSKDVESFIPGTVVKVNGHVDSYNGTKQLRINTIEVANSDEAPDASEFVKTASLNEKEMERIINDYINKIDVPIWHDIVQYIIKKYHDRFYQYPAAKINHHAYKGGLAFHTISILNLAQTLVEQHSNINSSLLYAGAILHDIGKVRELSGPQSTVYTTEGQLLGHISIGDGEIINAAKNLGFNEDSEEVMMLRHMILAHHGKKEWGSPVTPGVIEAQSLHELDNLDAKVTMFSKKLKAVESDKFSQEMHKETKIYADIAKNKKVKH